MKISQSINTQQKSKKETISSTDRPRKHPGKNKKLSRTAIALLSLLPFIPTFASCTSTPSGPDDKPLISIDKIDTLSEVEKGEELLKAVERNNISLVKALLGKGVDVNYQNKEYLTSPLKVAAFWGHRGLVQLLIQSGAKVDIKNHNGCTPLMYAAKHGRSKIVKLLIQNGANINAENNSGDTTLHFATEQETISKILENFKSNKNPDLDTINILLNAKANVNAKNEKGETPLHILASNENTNVPKFIKLLVNAGANVNERNKNGELPIHLACLSFDKGQTLSKITTLIELGSKIETRSYKEKKKPLDLIEDNTTRTRIEQIYLNKKVQEYTGKTNNLSLEDLNQGLIKASQQNDRKVSKHLIKLGANVNFKDSKGNSPIFYATEQRQIWLLEDLLKVGANVKTRNNIGNTILHHQCDTAIGSSDELTKYIILSCMLDVNSVNSLGQTPAHLAARSLNHKFLKVVEELGGKINLQDKDGDTPLIKAASCNVPISKISTLKLLISKSAKVNIQNKLGFTALHYAAEKNDVEAVKLLLANGADKNLKTNDGKTPAELTTNKTIKKLLK